MIFILHGEDISASRKKLNMLISGIQNINRFDGKKIAVDEIILAVKSQGLFLAAKTIVIENISKYSPKEISRLSEVFSKLARQKEITIYIWHTDVFSPSFLQKFKFAEVLLFPLPKYFFQFLDLLMPHEGKSLHGLLFKLYPQLAAEQILYALIKRVRQLLMIQSGEFAQFAETRVMQSWQQTKLARQAQLWSQKKLIDIYKKLFELEVGIKTSSLPSSLVNQLDILLLTEV